MYERFYNLRERPFSLTPDPDYLYPSRVHREALSYLRYGIESHAGFIVITGEIGSGKTTLLQTTLRGLDQQTSVARLINTALDARELIESVMLAFGLEPTPGMGKPYLIRDLAGFLVEQRNAGRVSLLVIDEAQNLGQAALEEVRMLSNIETEKSKLVQVILVGQPNLRTVLAAPALEQLRQRVTVSYHLPGLDVMETHAYLNHRLRRASVGAPIEFPASVSRIVHAYSRGIPRTVNVLADAILLFGYADDQRELTADLALEVMEELKEAGLIREPTQPFTDTLTQATSSAPAPATSGLPHATTVAEARRMATPGAGDGRLPPARPAAPPVAPAPRPTATPTAVSAAAQGPRATYADVAAAETPIRAAAPPPTPPAPVLPASRDAAPPPLGVWARLRNSVLGPDRVPGHED
ncbi:MAG: ExeA family protein [Vicinamibacterales bacterium]